MNNTVLDNIDLHILKILQEDALQSAKQIAFKVKRSTSNVQLRINRLSDAGYITGSMVLINPRMVDEVLSAYVNVQLNDHHAEALKIFQQTVATFPEVKECYHMTGIADFLAKVVVRDMNEYSLFLSEKLGLVKNVGSLQSSIVIQEVKRDLSHPIRTQ